MASLIFAISCCIVSATVKIGSPAALGRHLKGGHARTKSSGKSELVSRTGALGGTRTPTMLLTATSRQRVYQFRHERIKRSARDLRLTRSSPDQRRRCNKSMVEGQGLLAWWFCLAGARQSRQHLLDFDRDTV